MSKKILTEEEIFRIKELHAQRLPLEKVGRALKVDVARLRPIYREFGLQIKEFKRISLDLTPEQELEFIDLFNQGYGTTRLSRHFNLSDRTIKLYFKKLNLHRKSTAPNRTKILTPEQISKIKELYENGIPVKTIGKILNIGSRIVKRACTELGFTPRNSLEIIVPDEICNEIKRLAELKWGTRKIAKHLNLTRHVVKRIYNEFNISAQGEQEKWTPEKIPTERKCRGYCGQIKPIEQFRKRIRKNGKIEYDYYCRNCQSIRSKEKQENTPPDIWKAAKRKYNNKWQNKPEVKERKRKQRAEKRQKDPNYKLKLIMRQAIYSGLKENGGSKGGKIMKEYLNYNMDDLRQHLESRFEPWMNWKNWKKYNPKTWKDNDLKTHCWNVDHIIPQSFFKYTSVNDEIFKFCWSLPNLRPYSAKFNIEEGAGLNRQKAFLYVLLLIMSCCYNINNLEKNSSVATKIN